MGSWIHLETCRAFGWLDSPHTWHDLNPKCNIIGGWFGFKYNIIRKGNIIGKG